MLSPPIWFVPLSFALFQFFFFLSRFYLFVFLLVRCVCVCVYGLVFSLTRIPRQFISEIPNKNIHHNSCDITFPYQKM